MLKSLRLQARFVATPALTMCPGEQRERMASLRNRVEAHVRRHRHATRNR
jgi:hypothetical protein